MNMGTCLQLQDHQNIKIRLQSEGQAELPSFTFDRVFPLQTTQKEIYQFGAKPVIQSVLEGFNGTILAYGQTSSGKTFTMQGPSIDDEQLKGIIPRMVTNVFQHISTSPQHLEFRIKVGIVELYMQRVQDLLDVSKTNMKIREDVQKGIYIEDLTEKYVTEQKDVYKIMKIGNSNRAVTSTNMNQGSSRSHMVFMMSVMQNNLNDLSAKTGKLCLVDLAGSEKISKTGAEGKVLEEAKKINQSLSQLGIVINALTDGSPFIPYRNSKLTLILKDSLGGNSRTTLIVTCSPSPYNQAETISTLRFGIRAKSIKNKAKINRELTVAELQLLLQRAEIQIEEQQIQMKQLEEFIETLGHKAPQFEDVKKLKYEVYQQEDKREEAIKKKQQENEERIRNLQAELEEERHSVLLQTEKLNELRNEFQILSIEQTEAQKLGTDAQNELEIQRRSNLQKKEQILQKEAQIKQLKLTVDGTTNELQQIQNQLHIDGQRLAIKIEENHQLDSILKAMTQSNKDQNQKNSQAQNSLVQKDAYIEQLKRTIEELNLEIMQYQNNIFSQKAKNSSQQQELVQLDSLVQGMVLTGNKNEEQVQKIQNYILQMQSENSVLKETIDKLEIQLKQLAAPNSQPKDSFRVDDLQLLLQDLSSYNQSLSKNVEVQTSAEKLIFQKQFKQLNKRMVENSENQKNLIEQVKKLNQEVQKLPQLHADMKKKDEALIEIKQSLDKEREQFQHHLKKIQDDLMNRVEKVIELEIQIDEIRDEKVKQDVFLALPEKDRKKRLEDMEENIQNLNSTIRDYQRAHNSLQASSVVNEQKLQRQNQRILELEKELADCKERHAELQKNYQSLKNYSTGTQLVQNYNIDTNYISSMIEKQGEQPSFGRRLTNEFGKSQANIIKSIKGGGGNTDPQAVQQTFISSELVEISKKPQENE